MANELTTGRIPPALHEVESRYGVNWQNAKDVVFAPLWHRQTYPLAGANGLRFFQSVQGGSVTESDTNMTLAGTLPSPQIFLATGIYVDFRSGVPLVKGAQASAAAIPNAADDLAAVAYSGNVEFTVGNKAYAYGAPIAFFPPPFHLAIEAALSDATTAAASLLTIAANAHIAGPTFAITPIEIPSSQNFALEVNWPEGPVATPSGVDGTIAAGLLGYMYRPVQ